MGRTKLKKERQNIINMLHITNKVFSHREPWLVDIEELFIEKLGKLTVEIDKLKVNKEATDDN